MKSSFKSKTEIFGSTEPGQIVTTKNIHELPPGSVVCLSDGSKLIYLHDDLWLWQAECIYCYSKIDTFLDKLYSKATLEHIP